jgi:uncharacterized NAD(P)/FAD-binding protein YdhS
MDELKTTPPAFVQAVQECREKEAKRMGRAYASGYEAWAKLKHLLERAETAKKTLGTLQGDIWNAIKDDNDESVIVHLNAVGSQAMDMCVLLATVVAEANRAAEELAGEL